MTCRTSLTIRVYLSSLTKSGTKRAEPETFLEPLRRNRDVVCPEARAVVVCD